MDEATSIEPSSNEGPLWKYVTELEKLAGSTSKLGGNTHFKCNYCDGTFVGSYSRVKAHLLKISGKGIRACMKVTLGHRLEMQRVNDQVENDKLEWERKSRISLPLPLHGPIPSFRGQEGSGSTDAMVNGKRRKVIANSPLERAFQNSARAELDGRIVMMFYISELLFHFARNPNYRNSYAYAATHNIPGYVPSGYNTLRTTLL